MNSYERQCRKTQMLKEQYPPGTRILLLSMGDDPQPVPDNTKATVRFVDDIGTLHCAFDNGRFLGVVPGEDSFRTLTESEIEEEQEEKECQTMSQM